MAGTPAAQPHQKVILPRGERLAGNGFLLPSDFLSSRLPELTPLRHLALHRGAPRIPQQLPAILAVAAALPHLQSLHMVRSPLRFFGCFLRWRRMVAPTWW